MHHERIILAAHGAGDGSPANALAQEHAQRLERRLGVPVIAAFNLGTPTFESAVHEGGAARTLVVPLMLADGYFTRSVLRERVERAAATVGASISYAPAIGTLPSVHRHALDTLGAALAAHGIDPASAALVVIGHGTRRDAHSSRSALACAALARRRLSVAASATAFLDQEPTVERVVRELPQETIAVLPFLLGGGGHALDDIPRRIGASTGGRRVVVGGTVGELPDLVGLIADAVMEHAARPEVRLGTRRSELARIQAERARRLLEDAGLPTRLVYLDTVGDERLEESIEALPGEAPFTDDLDAALIAGRIDATTHSLKDLPTRPRPGIATVAHLPRCDAGEALVARDGLRLAELPPGAIVGTSSPRRTQQLLALRPDLTPRPMRGPVDDRVEQVRRGSFDAAILAVAGLERLGLDGAITDRFDVGDIAPEAGQGAIVIQARTSELSRFARLAELDDRRTRLAVEAELAFAGEIEQHGLIAAAHATVGSAGSIRLVGRIVEEHSRGSVETDLSGDEPGAVGRAAAQRLLDERPTPIGGHR